jgi:hypothetical protein
MVTVPASAAFTAPPELAEAEYLGAWPSLDADLGTRMELDGWGITFGSHIWLCGSEFDSSTFSIDGYTELNNSVIQNPIGGGLTAGTYYIFERQNDDDFFVILLDKDYTNSLDDLNKSITINNTKTIAQWQSAIQADLDAISNAYNGNGFVTYSITGAFNGAKESLNLSARSGVQIVWSADFSGTLSSGGLLNVSGVYPFIIDNCTITASTAAGGKYVYAVYAPDHCDLTVRNSTVTVSGQGSKAIVAGGYVAIADHSLVSASGYMCGAIEGASVSIYTNGGFVYATGGSDFAVSSYVDPLWLYTGAIVFADTESAVYNNSIDRTSAGGIVVGWNRTEYDADGKLTYTIGSDTDLTITAFDHNSAAYWAVDATQRKDGIHFESGNISLILDVGPAVVVESDTQTPTPTPTPAIPGADAWAQAELAEALELGIVPDSVAKAGWTNATCRRGSDGRGD